jgi:hypothetical protein
MTPEEAWRQLSAEWWDGCCDCYSHFVDFIEEHEELVLKVLEKK